MSLFSGDDSGCGSWNCKGNSKRSYLLWAAAVILAVVIIVMISLAAAGVFSPRKTDVGNGTSAASNSTTTTTPKTPAPENSYVSKTANVEFDLLPKILPAIATNSNEEIQQHQQLNITTVQDKMKEFLKEKANLEKAVVRILDLSSRNASTTKVTLRIGWINESMEFNQIQMSFANVTTFGGFDITPMTLSNVTDRCKFNKENCTCNFDYVLLEFMCTCNESTQACEIEFPSPISEKSTTSSARIETTSPEPQTTPKSTEAPSSAPKQGR
jgi:hypothetical protein